MIHAQSSTSATSAPRDAGSLPATLRAALAAGLTTGLAFGLADAAVADLRSSPPHGFVGYLGSYAGAVFAYSLVYGAALFAAGLALHPFLRRREPFARLRALLAVGLSLGLFLELYWWTRPLLFYGRSSVSPERLFTAAVLGALALGLGWMLAGALLKLPRRVRAAAPVLAALAMAGGALFIAVERRAIGERGILNERNQDLPNVLLVVVDALRWDVLGCYGSEVAKTPVMDRLAREGVLFEKFFVQAPYTWTSFGSILTGKYPRRHGLIAQRPGHRMVQTNVTLPYHLKTARHESGYHLRDEDYLGGTFMTGALSHGSGLDRGFDVYTEALMGHDVVEIDSQWSVFRSELLLWIFKNKIQQRVDFSLVVTLARGWLRRNHDRRWVAMVHLYSTHTPYDPPAEFRRMYVDPAYEGPFDKFYAYHREAIEAGLYTPTEADVQQIRNLYYGGVTQADSMIGELLDELERLGVLDQTLVIVTSDHGEDLGEREGVWEHNHMWNTNLRVPLLMAHPTLLPRGVRVSAITETVDLLPTVCELLGLELPPEVPDDPRSKIDGLSMVRLLHGNDVLAIKEFSFAENNLHSSIQDLRYKLIVPRIPHDLLGPQASAADLLDPVHDAHFFDLEADPEEFDNLVADPRVAGEVKRLYDALREWSDGLPIPESERVTTSRDREQIELLTKLGYAGMMADQDEEGRDGK